MKKRLILLLSMGLGLFACNNLFGPLSDDSGMDALGRLARGWRHMKEGHYEAARSDVAGALSMDSTLSEAYYLRALIALREYNVDVDDVNDALQVGGQSELADTNPAPFAALSQARQDSILYGNRLAYQYLAVLKSGQTPGGTEDLDTVFQFRDLWLDYTTTCMVVSMLALFDIDTSGSIDSLDSAAMTSFEYIYNDTGLGIHVKDTTLYSDDSLAAAASISLVYINRARPYADSLRVQYLDEQDTDAFIFRDNLRATLNGYRNELSNRVTPKGRK